ncbi:MAG: hypothetical protein RR543_02280 [Erysipelotrichales bacterium]
MSKKRKIISSSIIAIFIVLLIAVFTLYSKQVQGLEDLGYSKDVAKEKVNYSNFYNVSDTTKDELETQIDNKKDSLNSLGVNDKEIQKLPLSNEKLVNDLSLLNKQEDNREQYLNKEVTKLEKKAKHYKIKLAYPDDNIYQKYIYLNDALGNNYQKLVKHYYNALLKEGYSKKELLKMYDKKNLVKTLDQYENLYKKESAKKKKQASYFQTKELQAQAMRMFKETNEYRKSKGLKPYTYNYQMQSCVLREAKAYASNKNPHNWLCKAAANENAGVASINSDYVKLAMDFFKSDPPHEAVLSGNYNSVAISFVERNGTVYMIMDVFH